MEKFSGFPSRVRKRIIRKKKMAGKIKDKRHTTFNQVNSAGLNA
ncbi:hypothetical protein [Bacteroides sp. AM16-13]|nr:hypothetical protein [Bacteroides sp. AM16-13]